MDERGNIDDLIQALGDQKRSVRTAAAEALVDIGPLAVEHLIKALGDRDNRVQRTAAEVLLKIGDLEAINALIRALGYQKRSVRRAAKKAIVKFGVSAVDPLIRALVYENKNVRRAAAEAFWMIGGPKLVDPLIRLMGDQDDNVQRAALEALVDIGSLAVEHLIKAFYGEDKDIRNLTVIALLKISDNYEKAAEALVDIGPLAVEHLIKALGDRDNHVQRTAAEALIKIDDQRAIKAFLRVLREGNKPFLAWAEKAFVKNSDSSIIFSVIKELKNDDKFYKWLKFEIFFQLSEDYLKSLDICTHCKGKGYIIKVVSKPTDRLVEGVVQREYEHERKYIRCTKCKEK